MNKGAKVRRLAIKGDQEITACDKIRAKGFTTGRVYRVKAGRGDASLGLFGMLCGAFIISEKTMILTDDNGMNRRVAFDTRFWELVEDCANMYPIRHEVFTYKPSPTFSNYQAFRFEI